MLPLVITTSSMDIPNLHQQSWQTTLAHQLLQVIQLSDLITTNPTCVQDNLLYFGSTLIVEWETNQSTISRLHCHITATLPYQGYFAIARLFCHIKGTLPYHGYFAISRLLCHTTATLPYQGYFAIPRSLCHTTAILPEQGYFAISKLLCHITATLLYQSYFATNVKQVCHPYKLKDSRIIPGHPWSFPLICSFWSYRQMNATVKAKPTKNFSSKRKLPYHKICRSACFPPPPFFLFKASTFYPCVSYFIFLWPLWIPSFWHLSRR